MKELKETMQAKENGSYDPMRGRTKVDSKEVMIGRIGHICDHEEDPPKPRSSSRKFPYYNPKFGVRTYTKENIQIVPPDDIDFEDEERRAFLDEFEVISGDEMETKPIVHQVNLQKIQSELDPVRESLTKAVGGAKSQRDVKSSNKKVSADITIKKTISEPPSNGDHSNSRKST